MSGPLTRPFAQIDFARTSKEQLPDIGYLRVLPCHAMSCHDVQPPDMASVSLDSVIALSSQ